MSQHRFTMSVDVHDAAALHAAALAHPDAAGESLLHSDGQVDVDACLIILADPSTLPGCSIDYSDSIEVGEEA